MIICRIRPLWGSNLRSSEGHIVSGSGHLVQRSGALPLTENKKKSEQKIKTQILAGKPDDANDKGALGVAQKAIVDGLPGALDNVKVSVIEKLFCAIERYS
jgi:hypothetical protein